MTGPAADELSAIARAVRSGMEAAGAAWGLARRDPERAADFAIKAKQANEGALLRLVALGAERPGDAVAADSLPLELLDTPASRRLLSALEDAARAGADLDRERGWLDTDGQPCGWGETLDNLAAVVRVEVIGPQGRE